MFPVWNACLQKDSILTHYSVWMKKKKQLLNIYQLDIFIHMLLLTPSLAFLLLFQPHPLNLIF